MQLLHGAAFDNRHACFLGRPVDQNIFLHGASVGIQRDKTVSLNVNFDVNLDVKGQIALRYDS